MYKYEQGINPYQYNIEIVRGFFKKPLILIVAIATATTSLFSFLSSLFTDFLADIQPLSVVCGILGLVFSIFVAFYWISFYASCKSPMRSDKTTSSVKALRVLSIISFIVTGVFSFIITLFSILLLAVSNTVKGSASSSKFAETFPVLAQLIDDTNLFIFYAVTVAFILTAVLCIILFLYTLTYFLFINSVKKSITSIFLKKTGATAYGVFNIVFSILALVSFVFSIYQTLLFKTSPFSISFILNSLSSVCFIAGSFLNGIIAIQYSIYIKKHINGQTLKHQYKATASKQPYTPPIKNDYYVPVNQTVQEKPAVFTSEKTQPMNSNAYVRAENYNIHTVDDMASKPIPQQPKNEKKLYNETDSYLF